MLARATLVLALLAGVATRPAPALADAPPSDDRPVTMPSQTDSSKSKSKSSSKSSKTAKKSKSSKTAKSTKKSKSKRTASKSSKKSKGSKSKQVAKSSKKRKKTREVSRTPSTSSLAQVKNMPRGYTWPPDAAMLTAERACEDKLDAAGVAWKRAEPEGRIVSPMTVADDDGVMILGGITYTSAYRKGPHKLDCQLALAMANFGPQLAAVGVKEIKFGSIYRWTNVRVNGQNKNMLSRHALGIAMDIVSMTDINGRVAVVETDYPKADPLLLAVEGVVNASGMFRVLLTPANDPASHHDHFHIEVKVDYTAEALATHP